MKVNPKPFYVISAILIAATGCRDRSLPVPESVQQPVAVPSGSAGLQAAEPPRSVAVVEDPRFVALSNQLQVLQQGQLEQVQKLVGRIEQLERRNAELTSLVEAGKQARDSAKGVESEAQARWGKQVAELESKIAALQAGRVLPEIIATAQEGPTARELDQKIRVFERKNELAAEAAEAKAKEAPRLAIGSGGISFTSADTNFVVKLKGLVQLDSRTFFGDNELSSGNDGFVLRRARPILEATLYRDFDFAVVPELAGGTPSLLDAYANYRYRPELQLKAGKFKSPIGLEQLQVDSAGLFAERSFVSSLVPNRDVGVQLWGDLWEGGLSYAVGVFNGVGDGRNAGNTEVDDDKQVASRVFSQPFRSSDRAGLKGFGIGLGGSISQVSSNSFGLPATTGGTLPGYATDGQQQWFAYNPLVGTVVADGQQWRLSPQASYAWGSFGILTEYAISHQSVLNNATLRQADLEHTGWQVGAQWVVSGEAASFGTIVPARPFDFHGGGWGAWQLVGRVSGLSVDERAFQGFSNPATSASEAVEWAVGVNWWLNRNARVSTSFSRTTFQGGGAFNPVDPTTRIAPATVTHQDENRSRPGFSLRFEPTVRYRRDRVGIGGRRTGFVRRTIEVGLRRSWQTRDRFELSIRTGSGV